MLSTFARLSVSATTGAWSKSTIVQAPAAAVFFSTKDKSKDETQSSSTAGKAGNESKTKSTVAVKQSVDLSKIIVWANPTKQTGSYKAATGTAMEEEPKVFEWIVHNIMAPHRPAFELHNITKHMFVGVGPDGKQRRCYHDNGRLACKQSSSGGLLVKGMTGPPDASEMIKQQYGASNGNGQGNKKE